MAMHITGMKLFYSFLCLLVVFIVSTFIGAIQADAAVDENTVAVWLFEEGAGNVVKDASGNGHDGEFEGSPKWVKGKFGTGLEFPGDSSGYVVVNSTKQLELEELSIEAWVKVEESTGKWQGMVCKQQAGCGNRNYGIWVHVDQSVLHAQIGANGACAFSIDGTTDITDDKWHHLAFTFDGKMGRVYVDGELENEAPNDATFQSADPITIGVPNLNNANGLKGIIEEIRISNTARTEEEIQEAMNVGLAQILSIEPGGKLSTRWAYLKHVP
ncbi:MAG: LamG domain-containing protein [Candidatus Poribacteria bacterium]|nr:LamG domain-containing protein [Candidatus Poribacteria bacterium]MYK20237.1 LamG domain-containing protein [Candidatus Poribacteria bacterium]